MIGAFLRRSLPRSGNSTTSASFFQSVVSHRLIRLLYRLERLRERLNSNEQSSHVTFQTTSRSQNVVSEALSVITRAMDLFEDH
jgi:hypothetical protein